MQGIALGMFMDSGAASVILGLIGALIGVFIGRIVSSIATVMIEWLAQMIVAQGQVVAELQRKA